MTFPRFEVESEPRTGVRDAAGEELARLKQDLWMTRLALIATAPDRARLALEELVEDCLVDDLWGRRSRAIDRLVALADVRPAEEMGGCENASPRALCPLCGCGANSPLRHRGFAVPMGMQAHLEGSYRAVQCPVFAAAFGIARDRTHDRFRATLTRGSSKPVIRSAAR